MKRAKLRQVVSAVYHLRNGRGVRLADIEEYLRMNYGVLSAPEYKPTLKMAVREGFLKMKNNRFHPSTPHNSLSPSFTVARQKRKPRKPILIRAAIDYLLARRRRRRGRRHTDILTAKRRRRRSRRRRHEENPGNQPEEKKENAGENSQDKQPDPAPSSLVEERENCSEQAFYFGNLREM